MAVEAVVSAVAEKLTGLLIEEVNFLRGVEGEVEWIKAELRGLLCFLRDAEEKQGLDRVKTWIADLRDVAYDAEDIVDTLILRNEQKKNTKPIKRYASIFCDLIACHKVGNEIEQIRKRLVDISQSQSDYDIKKLEANGEASSNAIERLRERRQNFPHFEEYEAIGQEEDLEIIKSRLFQDDLNRRVVPIVGLGGLGKTTLAKKIYNNNVVTDHFDCQVWITVSQEYSAKGLLEDIWKQVINTSTDNLTIQHMAKELCISLKEKKYLVVMDDVWGVQAWNNVIAAFPDSNNGSRVLLTTRKRDVALQVQVDKEIPLHEPKLLNFENSWILFLKKVGLDESKCPPNLVELGKQIVDKCDGLPLAIVVLGGLLSTKEKTYGAWLKVYDSVRWQLRHDQSMCWEILAMSYIDLPHYLKPCFIYLGIFPEDDEISTRKLIGLWVAEGLVQHRDNESLEDVADDYIEELTGRSMIQVAKRGSDGKIKTCRMHDLLRDLALSKAEENKLFHIYGNRELTTTNEVSTSTEKLKIRRLVAHHNINNCPSSTKNLRSYLVFSLLYDAMNGELVSKYLENGIQNRSLRLLRVLDLGIVEGLELPEALGQLIHLRYLGLRKIGTSGLPSSLAKLRNLQTLVLKYTQSNFCFYLPIWKLQQLRHLHMNNGVLGVNYKIGHPPVSNSSSSFSLRNLQSLVNLYINEETPINGGLDNSLHLKKLKVCGKLASQREALLNWIVKLDRLEVLKLWSITEREDENRLPTTMQFSNNRHLYKMCFFGKFAEKFLEFHEFPPNLTVLTLMRCELKEDPFPTLEKLQNLRILKLKVNSYKGKEMVCTSGGFQQLQHLEVHMLWKLESWKVEDGAMLNLKKLVLDECNQLKMIPDGLQHITTLQEFRVKNMPPKFRTRMASDDDDDAVDWYKIKHIPSIWIEGKWCQLDNRTSGYFLRGHGDLCSQSH